MFRLKNSLFILAAFIVLIISIIFIVGKNGFPPPFRLHQRP